MPALCGREWIVEAHGCWPSALRDLPRLQALFTLLTEDLELHAVEEPRWHTFPGTGGITGLSLLAESHLACHTFPEYGSLCLNVFCCSPKPDWEFREYLAREFGANSVSVRRVERPYQTEGLRT
jgi:S-adenosylmethionine decarboxylase